MFITLILLFIEKFVPTFDSGCLFHPSVGRQTLFPSGLKCICVERETYRERERARERERESERQRERQRGREDCFNELS